MKMSILLVSVLFIVACNSEEYKTRNPQKYQTNEATIVIEGQGVVTPGEYSYTTGMTLTDLVELAGGWRKCVSKKRTTVSRISDGEITRKRISLDEELLPSDVVGTGCPFF
jgi:protein involved in polysaccharide export with SLBB domain